MVHVFGAKEYADGRLQRDECNCGEKHVGVPALVTFHRRYERTNDGLVCVDCGFRDRTAPAGSIVIRANTLQLTRPQASV